MVAETTGLAVRIECGVTGHDLKQYLALRLSGLEEAFELWRSGCWGKRRHIRSMDFKSCCTVDFCV